MKAIKIKLFQVLSVLAIVFTGAVGYSQPNHPGNGPRPIPNKEQIHKMVLDLQAKLSLSEEQKGQIESLYNTHFEELKKMHNQNEEAHKDSRDKMEAFRKEFEKEVKSLLSESQQQKYDEFLGDHKPENFHPRPHEN